MFNSKYFITFATISVLLSLPSVASANDRDLIATTIPASACRPSNDTEDGRVRLSNGAYVFNSSSTGTVVLYCPLPINGFTISDTTADNDISSYRVYCRDTDGAGNTAQVTTQLQFRNANNITNVGGVSSCVPPGGVNGTVVIPRAHDVGIGSLYFFRVTISRTNTTQDPAFSGIDFPSGSTIP